MASLSGDGFREEDLLCGFGEGARELDRLGGFEPDLAGDGALEPGLLPGLEPGRDGEGARELARLAGLEAGLEGPRDEGSEDLEGPEMDELRELCLEPSYLPLNNTYTYIRK